MLEIIFVRHGETDSNIRGTFCGWTDIGLSEKGTAQADAAAGKLASMAPDCIYCSPLKRTRQTAEILNRNFNIPVIYDERLKERNFGKWEDLTYKEVCSRFPEEKDAWEKDWVNYCIAEGESALEAYERIGGFLRELVERRPDGNILVVTHLGTIRAALAWLLGLSCEGSWHFSIDNCGTVRVRVDESGYAYLCL